MSTEELPSTGTSEAAISPAEIDLVARIAREPRYSGIPSVDFNDRFQAGVLGLFEARKRFDASRGASFLTYAQAWIREAIRKEIDFHLSAGVEIPESDRKDAEGLRRVERRLHVELGRTPTVDELCTHSSFNNEKVQRLIRLSSALGLGDLDVSCVSLGSAMDSTEQSDHARTQKGRTGRPKTVSEQPITLLDALMRRCDTSEERVKRVCGVDLKTVKRWRNGESVATSKRALDGLYALFPGFVGEPEELFRAPSASDPLTGALWSTLDESGEHDPVYSDDLLSDEDALTSLGLETFDERFVW